MQSLRYRRLSPLAGTQSGARTSRRSSTLLLALFVTAGGLADYRTCTADPPGVTGPDNSLREKAAAKSDINRDETVVFYPTSARLDENGGDWLIPVHGIVYEPTANAHRRAAMAAAIGSLADSGDVTRESRNLMQRVDLFLVDNERGQEISIRIGDQIFDAGKSSANGHFANTIRLDEATVNDLIDNRGENSQIVEFEAVTRSSDPRKFIGRIHLVGPTGLSIISDIDDTIKHSEVTDREAVLENTFLRDFQSIPGMPELYQHCDRLGFAFHYVSGSPWQLYLPLTQFFDAERYPRGSFDLKHFRLKTPSTAADMLRSPQASKTEAINRILKNYPRRHFILIGDSGEQDPEIYSEAARNHRGQVAAIFIRNLTNDNLTGPRFQQVTQGLDNVRFRLFEDPEELKSDVDEIHRDLGTPAATDR